MMTKEGEVETEGQIVHLEVNSDDGRDD